MEKKKIGVGVCFFDFFLVIILLIVLLENCLVKYYSVLWEILYFFVRVFFYLFEIFLIYIF